MGVAVALRGDRGLELKEELRQFMVDLWLRSPFGAIEDWNMETLMSALLRRSTLRSPFGAIEDWNPFSSNGIVLFPQLRSPFGAIEDWN